MSAALASSPARISRLAKPCCLYLWLSCFQLMHTARIAPEQRETKPAQLLLTAVPCLQERLFDVSDAYRVHVCSQCGMMAVANLRTQAFHCRACKMHDTIVQVRFIVCLPAATLAWLYLLRYPSACLVAQLANLVALQTRLAQTCHLAMGLLLHDPPHSDSASACSPDASTQLSSRSVCRCTCRTPPSCCSRSSWPWLSLHGFGSEQLAQRLLLGALQPILDLSTHVDATHEEEHVSAAMRTECLSLYRQLELGQ